MSRLAARTPAVHQGARALEGKVLEHAAAVLDAPRVLMAWEEVHAPSLHLAWWSGGEFHRSDQPASRFQPLVAEPLDGTDFLCLDARAPLPTVLHTCPGGWKRWQGAPVHPELREQFGMSTVLSVRLRGGSPRARLFFLNKPGMTSDDLPLGGLAARIGPFSLLQRVRQVAAMEERIRLSREVHDGPMQSLTGVSLKLQAASDLVEEDPKAARERLGEIQRLIAEEQRNLRLFFQELRSGGHDSPAPDASLAARLGELVKAFQNVWGLSADLKAEAVTAPVPANLAYEAARIVREALVNAAKHAQASSVRVELGGQDGHIHITVADNGRGFPFRGRYDHAALARLKLGPVCLKERVESLGGSLAIASTDAGARVDVILPLRQPGADDVH